MDRGSSLTSGVTEVPLPAWVSAEEFPFRRRRLELAPGEELSVVDVGQGPVVLFSHGTPMWSFEFRAQIAALSKSYRCIAPDHLGFGLSGRPPGGDYRPEAHARRFAQLPDLLGVREFHLVVHDFGGPFALPLALAEPGRVRSLTLLNSFAWGFGDSPRNRRLARLAGGGLFRFLYRNFNFSFVLARSAWGKSKLPPSHFEQYRKFFPDAGSRELVLWALARSMEGSHEFCESIWAEREKLASIPFQILWGLKDSAFPPETLARFEREFPVRRVERFEHAGHFPHEEEPERVTEALQRFLFESEQRLVSAPP